MFRNRVRQRLIVVAVAIAALSASFIGTGYAQEATWAGTSLEQMLEMAHWKLGLLRANAAFSLSNVGHDSDVYFGYLDEPVPDFTGAPSLALQVLVPVSRKIVLDLVDSPQYVFYVSTENERAWNNSFRGRVHFSLEKLYFQAGASSSNVRRRMSPELDVNIREKTNSLEGLALWQVSRPTSLAVLYAAEDYNYGGAEFQGINIAEALNRKENLVDLVAYIQPNPRIRLFLDGQYGTYTFPEVTEMSRDAQSYGIMGGFELIPKEGEVIETARVQGDLSLGYVRFDMKNPQFVDGSGLSGDVDISLELLRKTTARIFFSRGFEFSVFSGASYYISTVFGGGMTRRLSRRAILSYNLSFGRSDYPQNRTGIGIPQGLRNQFTTHSGSVELRVARGLTMTIIGTFGKRVIDQEGQTRNRNFLGFNLIYGSPPGRISAPQRGMTR